ncbi:MAG: single-stranded DNA-binding protein [Planctomycetes bacterium]|nr:single-stranded DNA-binding protein [Planctomycetota bacterium]
MANFNSVMLLGNLTRDPELRSLPSGSPVAEFGLAVNRVWNGAEGEKREETCFVEVSVYGRSAENVHRYLRKGRPVFLQGRLKYDAWTGEDGKKRSKLKVVAERVQFLNSRRDGGKDSPPGAPEEEAQEEEEEAMAIPL